MSPWYPHDQPQTERPPQDTQRPEVKYEPRECRLRHKPVWAILTKLSGDWTVVNCLDKERACGRCRCALVSQHGLWPFEEP